MPASNITHSHANCTLSYTISGRAYAAKLRCIMVQISYSVNSEESHARTYRAFYPHRRSQGSFALQFQFKGWAEHTEAMTWFQDYINNALNDQGTGLMSVTVPSRDFSRTGVPTVGQQFGDHVGSMVFNPTIQFTSLADPSDPNATISKVSSYTEESKGALSTLWFYPDSTMNQPGNLQDALYNQQAGSTAANLQNQIGGDTGGTVTPITPGGSGGPVRAE